MASTDVPPLASTFPADDEVEDARWLASLIAALQVHAKRHGHPEVVAALDPALDAAQAIADASTAK